ncbi:MAG TPA: dihydroneopterin aldolase [Verrucomicrobiae bacterium]|jgi:dihydroneopterin aldolase|nr:dihydroneopterin aldolase [Verrucomicrobiae bacterium]
MSNITIVDLEVFWHVGVPDEERINPQRLLMSVDMSYDISRAAQSDRPDRTIDYAEVIQEIKKYGVGREWKLIEKIAAGLGHLVLTKFSPDAVFVEIKKFPIPQARYVSVIWTGQRQAF